MGCPSKFKLNCKNYGTKCNSCKALGGTRGFYYHPLTKLKGLGYEDHPYITDRVKCEKELAKENKEGVKEKRDIYKKAIRQEKAFMKSIGARSTIASGAINNDGDGLLDLSKLCSLEEVKKLRIEFKSRFNGRNELGPTKKEWEKALAQNISIFAVKGSGDTIVTMKLETLKYLLSLIKETGE